MQKKSSRKSTNTHLIEVLQRLDFWLSRDEMSHIIVVQPSLRKMKQQHLPAHIRLTPRKLKGPRQPIRGRRHYDQQHLKLARWPNDGMDENALPFILCVLSGQADFRVADYVLHCSVGDWVFVPPGIPKPDGNQPHFEGDAAGRHCDVFWIYTALGRDDGVNCWICRSREHEHAKDENSGCRVDKPFVAQLFNGFCDEILTRNQPEIITHLLRGVLLMISTEIKTNNAIIGGTKYSPELKMPQDPIEAAQFYITTNIYRHLTIHSVARHVLVSPSTLTRRFRERTGRSFNEFLNAERVALASNLLRETNLPISLIGEKVGLKYGQLRILIQKEHHCSPGELRAKNRKNN